MRHGTLRGFIPHSVWAEVPRVLADRKREGGTFDLARAERLWWHQYVPLLHVVCVDGLPMTAAADKLAHEDLSDVGILQLADVLAPVVLLPADRDLIRQGVAVPNWEAVRGVLGRIGKAEAGMQGGTTTIVGAGYVLAGAMRLARAHPVAATVAVAAASATRTSTAAGSPATPARSSPGSARRPSRSWASRSSSTRCTDATGPRRSAAPPGTTCFRRLPACLPARPSR
ncbi:hypothetical protein AB0H03_32740 [Streptomyces sparsogenes]|uniref:hypothetical protein n=1 Tax=Streptomyces sparsogenes TaxID=67365 RepID=UPI0033F12D35